MGISLDARYSYEVDTENREIIITDNQNYIEGFWPRGIGSLAAIVGNNGSGKTSSLLSIIQALEDGNGEKDVAAIIIYKEGDTLYAYIPEDFHYGYSVIMDINGKYQQATERPRVGLFYYSGYFRPYKSVDVPGEGELSGVYNASDTWKLMKDYQDYSNVDTMSQGETIGMHMLAMQAQDDNRIVMMLRDKELRDLLPINAIPKYILVEPSVSGYWRLKSNYQKTGREINTLVWHTFGTTKEDYLAQIAYADFFNFAVDFPLASETVISLQQEWARYYNETNDVVNSLSKLLQRNPSYSSYLLNLEEIILFLRKACSFNNNSQTLFIDLIREENKETFDEMCNYFSMPDFVVAHYFDLGYAREQSASTRLSSGELDMLKFFSRLHDAALVQPGRFSNLECPQMILVDEAENSYHPEWQRRYIQMLVEFVDALYRRVEKKAIDEGKYDNQGHPLANLFQIVLTTHSPILLSDIPLMCTNYLLKKEGSEVVQTLKDRQETFGANIYDLYKDAFFLCDGLIGEFAYRKINAIRQTIERSETLTDDEVRELTRQIEMIGDKVIRHYLLSLIEEKNKTSMLSYYERKIKELKGE